MQWASPGRQGLGGSQGRRCIYFCRGTIRFPPHPHDLREGQEGRAEHWDSIPAPNFPTPWPMQAEMGVQVQEDLPPAAAMGLTFYHST